MMNKAYGFLIKRNFKILDLESEDSSNEILSKQGDAYLKNFGCTHERLLSIDKINNKVVGKDKLLHKEKNPNIKFDIRFHSIQGSLLLKQ